MQRKGKAGMIQGNRTPVGEDSAASELPDQPRGQAGGLRGPPPSPLRHRLLCNWGAVLVDRLGSWGWSSVGSTTAMATLVEKPPSGQASHQQHCHLLSLAEGSLWTETVAGCKATPWCPAPTALRAGQCCSPKDTGRKPVNLLPPPGITSFFKLGVLGHTGLLRK